MKVRMLITSGGSPDGIQINEYRAGQTYDLPEWLADIFLDVGKAEEVKAFDQAPEIKMESEPIKVRISKKKDKEKVNGKME